MLIRFTKKITLNDYFYQPFGFKYGEIYELKQVDGAWYRLSDKSIKDYFITTEKLDRLRQTEYAVVTEGDFEFVRTKAEII